MSWYRKKQAEIELAIYEQCERLGLRPSIGDYLKAREAQQYLDRVRERERLRLLSERLDRYR